MDTSKTRAPGALLLLSLASIACAANAAPPSSSAYVTDTQNSHVEDATSQGIGQVNMIACIMAAMRPDALVNEGNYNALVDESKCEPNGSSGSSSGGDVAQGASFMTATVNASRASNTDPMISKIWIVQEEEGHETNIDVHVAATAAPSANNPYGSFRLDFCGKRADSAGCRMNGYLEGGDTGIRYFETETRDDGHGVETQTTALKLNATGTTTGSGRMQIDSSQGQGAFDFAYNAGLYRRSDGSDDQCFSRDASDPDTGQSVWRYGLYDETTGARITRHSGFPIEFTAGGQTYQGYLGYFGLSLPTPALNALTNGSTVKKVDYSGGQAVATNYTVITAAGKLTKYTRQTRSLQGLDQIKFTTMVGFDANGFFNGATPNTQYELYWNDAAKNFKVTGQMNCGNNGCQLAALPQEQTVSVAYWQTQGGVQGWSQSLGGEVFIDLHGMTAVADSGAVNVVFRTQDLVYPSQLPATLYCVRDCPTQASLTAYFSSSSNTPSSPYSGNSANNWGATQAGDVVTYHSDSTQAVLLDAASQPVVFTDADSYQQHSQFAYGVRSGRLFETLSDASCDGGVTYCDYKVNGIEIYYQWETGPNSSNHFAAVKDSSNAFVTFDAPLQVTFDVPADAAIYKEYAGKSLVLQYGGFGDLWGIPGICVSPATNEEVACNEDGARYVPSFIIPFNTPAGHVKNNGTTYLVKWLDREIRFAKKSLGTCTTAGLNLPTGITLPTVSDLKNPSDANSDVYIGTKPVVTAAPRVIHGEVKY